MKNERNPNRKWVFLCCCVLKDILADLNLTNNKKSTKPEIYTDIHKNNEDKLGSFSFSSFNFVLLQHLKKLKIKSLTYIF